jgi:hypothetical protein
MPVSDSLFSTFMQDLPVNLTIAGFLALEIGALLTQHLVSVQFDIWELSAAGRNEVRGVYRRLGAMVAVVLELALQYTTMLARVLVVVASALARQAAGRFVLAVIDSRLGAWSLQYLALEAFVATMLVWAAVPDHSRLGQPLAVPMTVLPAWVLAGSANLSVSSNFANWEQASGSGL